MIRRLLFALAAAVTAGGCLAQTIKVDPVHVEPIHMTVDVNIHDSHSPMPASPQKP